MLCYALGHEIGEEGVHSFLITVCVNIEDVDHDVFVIFVLDVQVVHPQTNIADV